MRVRTDEKRQAILAVARTVFEEVGFARASMAAIATRLGGSKATLYGYFSTKDELFAAAMTGAHADRGDEMIAVLDDRDGDVAEVLTRFGRTYLAFVTSHEIQALGRTCVAESQFSDVGREVYVRGPQRGLDALSDYFRAQTAGGRLAVADPDLAAHQFKALIEAGTVEPQLYGVAPRTDHEAIVTSAVALFLAGYSGRPRADATRCQATPKSIAAVGPTL